MRLLLTLLCLYIPEHVFSQAMDNTALYNALPANNYLRAGYDNDFFSGEDRYYTQGINIEWASPVLNNFIAHKILLKPSSWDKTFSIAAEHNAYTPTSIQSDSILYDNRPFAAALFAKFGVMATQPEKKRRLSSTLSIGIIGPAAAGKEMQTGIHEATGNIIPKGWQYQVQNDLVLNYQINYDKNIFAFGDYFSLDGNAMARLGTLSTKTSLGLQFSVGHFDNFYRSDSRKKFTIMLYAAPKINAIGYDATLRGGIFTPGDPYTINASEIRRFIFETRYGLRVSYKSICLSYFQSYQTKEFNSGNNMRFGGVQLAVLL